jgi:polysaccharide biosynthesis/export protein
VSATRLGAAAGLGLAVLAAGGCAVIPTDGPTSHTIAAASATPDAAVPLVDLDFKVAQTVAAVPPDLPPSVAEVSSDAASDVIREGDTLALSIFEANGAEVFQPNSSDPTTANVSASQQALPRIVVDPRGAVDVPFAGMVHVAGLTPDQAGVAVAHAMSRRIPNPQVVVSVLSSNANSVSVMGEVRGVGRFPLSPNGDRLLDIITLAGGPTKPYQDIDVQIVRGERTVSIPMADVLRSADQNIRLAPKDQIRLLPNERKYSVFGAFDHVTQIPVVDDHVSLAAAISRAGGMDTWTADNATVFVFRFERPEVARALDVRGMTTPRGVPMIYRLNLRKSPAGLLIADSFDVHNGDLLYVPRANLVAVTKFMQVVNAFAQTGYTVRATGGP